MHTPISSAWCPRDVCARAGSVTGLIHRFSAPFEPDVAIRAMMSSARWPRPGYLVRPATVTCDSIGNAAGNLFQCMNTCFRREHVGDFFQRSSHISRGTQPVGATAVSSKIIRCGCDAVALHAASALSPAVLCSLCYRDNAPAIAGEWGREDSKSTRASPDES